MTGRKLAIAGLVFGLALAGCGGSDDDATVEPAVDRSDQISQLQKRKQRLEEKVAAEEAKRKAAAEQLSADSGGDAAVHAMLSRLPGESGLAVGAPGAAGPVLTGGSFTTGDAWSTIKVPIAERVLADAGGPGGLSSAQSDQITAAITLSDNDAAAALFDGLEADHGGLGGASEAVGEMLRRAGDTETVVSTVGRGEFTTYGQTDWSLDEQERYMGALAGGCISDAASRSYLLGEMASVGGSDTFGLAAAGFPAKWKGGWGPGTDGRYLVRQMGVMDVEGKEVVVAMAAIPDDGTFESGQAMLSDIARWTAANLTEKIPAPTGC